MFLLILQNYSVNSTAKLKYTNSPEVSRLDTSITIALPTL
jgi:hypothetical protein